MQPSRFLVILSIVAIGGCSTRLSPADAPGNPPLPAAPQNVSKTTLRALQPAPMPLHTKMLIFATNTGELRYWPVRTWGSKTSEHLATLQNVMQPTAMAADGDTLAIGVGNPASVVLYDTGTGQQTNISDSDGVPSDVAFDRQGNILTINRISGGGTDVVVYTPPQYTATELTCSLIGGAPAYVAADRHGNIFVNDGSIVEIPKGPNGYEPRHCSTLPLQLSGYAAGLLVDPMTDALVIFHNPDECAGGNEANMSIYAKPYGSIKAKNRRLGPICASVLRFGPYDQQVFFFGGPTEAPRNGARPAYSSDVLIHQRTYPDGQHERGYRDPPIGPAFTTIPNRLPN